MLDSISNTPHQGRTATALNETSAPVGTRLIASTGRGGADTAIDNTTEYVGARLIAPTGRSGADAETRAPNAPDPLDETVLEQSRYVVHLPSFEGPLDLLLHLIEKRQMEITTISLLAVTDQYLAYLAQWEVENAPLANMAAFVVIAARLLYIKSQSLLPRTSREELANETETAVAMAEELQRHLLEYKYAKEIAHYLRQRSEAGLQTFARSGLLAGIEAQLDWTPPTITGLDLPSLSATFQRLLERLAKDEMHDAVTLPLERVRVSERMAEIATLLATRPRILLTEIIENETSRFVIIVTFLAVLEMWKHERIAVRQDKLLGPISLERGARWGEQDALDEVEA